MRVGVHVFDGAEELDWVGPWEVLAAWGAKHPDDDVEVVSVARYAREVRCAKGLRVVADRTWEDVGGLDLLVYPGGRGVREHLGDGEVHRWLRSLHDGGTLIASVCTGALVLADAGLLDGAPATTHWSALDDLARLGRDVEVRAEDRFVDNGRIVTAAGVSAGIDMALHLVARLHSTERAREVRRYIQYDPDPPV
jgi:transcriptional regulator GlxA family with amidase domain